VYLFLSPIFAACSTPLVPDLITQQYLVMSPIVELLTVQFTPGRCYLVPPGPKCFPHSGWVTLKFMTPFLISH
jgi:hypothetical protein